MVKKNMFGLVEMDKLRESDGEIEIKLPPPTSRSVSPLRIIPITSPTLDTMESPDTQRRRIENHKLEEEWTGCCSKTDKHCLKFIVQVGMGASVCIFSMIQIARGVGNREIYFSLLSGTMALFFPNPTLPSSLNSP